MCGHLQLEEGVVFTVVTLHPGVPLHSSLDLQNPYYSSLLIFLRQTLPRLYGGRDANKCPLATQMRTLSFSSLLSNSKIWLTFLVTVYYKINLLDSHFTACICWWLKVTFHTANTCCVYASGVCAKPSPFYQPRNIWQERGL